MTKFNVLILYFRPQGLSIAACGAKGFLFTSRQL